MTHQSVLDRLAELFVNRGVPEYVRSDNGSEFTAQAAGGWLKAAGVKTLYIEPGSPWEMDRRRDCDQGRRPGSGRGPSVGT